MPDFKHDPAECGDYAGRVRMAARIRAFLFRRSMSITSIGGMSWEPAFYKTFINLKDDGIRTLTGDQELSDFINSNVSMLRDFNMNE